MNREAGVWVKIIMHSTFLGQHFTEITWDWVCLVYTLMTGTELNFGAIYKSSMRKARAHRGCRYAIGGSIIGLCRRVGIPEECLNYFPYIEAPPYCVINIKGLNVSLGPVLTTV